jgi:hypothetical protein
MADIAGFVQGPVDSTGKRIANSTYILRIGSRVINADGTFTVLTADTPVYLQKIVLSDMYGQPIEPITNEDTQLEILNELRRIRRGIGKICGDTFLNDGD